MSLISIGESKETKVAEDVNIIGVEILAESKQNLRFDQATDFFNLNKNKASHLSNFPSEFFSIFYLNTYESTPTGVQLRRA